MPPISPSTELYTIGKGVFWIAEWSGGTPGAYADVGNCPKMEVEVTVETLDHFSSRSGAKNKDKSVVIERGYKVNFDLDEMARKNLAIFLMGSQDGNTVHALTNTTKEYALKFKADNAAGPNDIWEFWKCSIKPSGATGLITEDWRTLSFVAEGLADVANHPESPYFDVTGTTTTSTTTTTTTTA
jgi:hypothetical protein